ncbi:MAG: hypothetical protein JRI64_09775, partial [Deltaproteobacteria bacterium]|nr:hypothetical protein [Deltaproteobacteria bacterium]
MSRDLLVRAIVVISMHDRSLAVMSSSRPAAPIVGISLAVMSSSRPAAPIVGICTDLRSSRLANLLWGVIPITVDPAEIDNIQSLARRVVVELGLAVEGQNILVVRGFSDDPKQNTPNLT